MKVTPLDIPDVLHIEPTLFGDARGFFLETFNAERYAGAGISMPFVQDNVSFSARGVLRGMHFQKPRTQGKLVMALVGEIFDVAIDVRVGSPTFGKWVGMTLTGERKNQLWVPPGFAHGFCVVSETALVSYKCTDLYSPKDEVGIRYDDPDVGIAWPMSPTSLSTKDASYPRLRDLPREQLFRHEGTA